MFKKFTTNNQYTLRKLLLYFVVISIRCVVCGCVKMSKAPSAVGQALMTELAEQPDVLADGTGATCLSELFLCWLNGLVESGIEKKITADSLPAASPTAEQVICLTR